MLIGLLALGGCKKEVPFEFADVRIDGHDDDVEARGPQLCTAPGLVYVAWQHSTEAEAQVHFNRSTDGGTSFEPVSLELSATPGATANPALGCDGGTVAVAWEDTRDSPFDNPGIYVAVSDDGGLAFREPASVTGDAFGDWRSVEPQVAVTGDVVVVVFSDGRSGSFDIYANVSLDAGKNWLEDPVRIDTDARGAAWSSRPRVEVDGEGGVYVAWVDRRDVGNDIYANRSLQHGLPGTWLAEDVRVDVGDDPGEADSYVPDLAVEDGTVAIAWHDRRRGTADIFVATGDVDLLLDDPVRVDVGDGESLFADVALRDGQLFTAWRDDVEGQFDIFVASSEDGSDWTEGIRLDEAGGASHAESPGLSPGLVAGDVLAVTWADHRNSGGIDDLREDVYVATSTDGVDWTVEQADDPESGKARSVYPVTAVESGRVHVVWEDWRAGDPDVYYRRFRP